MEVRIPNYKDGDLLDIHKGHQIEIQGEVVKKNQIIYLYVLNIYLIEVTKVEKKVWHLFCRVITV